jgi:hypothetical protein
MRYFLKSKLQRSCRYQMSSDTSKKRALGLVLLAISVVLIGTIIHSASDDHAKNPEPVPPPVAPADPPLPVTARQLFRDYRRNEVSADAKYKDKILAVTGTVGSINKGFTQQAYLVLSTGDFMSVNANLEDSETAKAARLSIGESVTVVCTGAGMVIGSPILHDCVIQ